MPITVVMPSSSYSVADLIEIIDFITTDATISGVEAGRFYGSGVILDKGASFSVTGSGFAMGLIDGVDVINQGIVQKIVLNIGDDKIKFTSVAVDMAEFGPIIAEDLSGSDLFAIEDFLLQQDWKVTLGNGNDRATKSDLVGDGNVFNMQGNDKIHGKGGNDNLYVGGGNDVLKGGNGNDKLNGGAGHDKVSGGNGRDKLIGEKGNDVLKGGNGADVIKGGGGADKIVGGKGKDKVIGNGGADEFVFSNGSGKNKIVDFDTSVKGEHIDLSDVSRIKNFADLMDNHISEKSGSVIIKDGHGFWVEIEGVKVDDLSRNDFDF